MIIKICGMREAENIRAVEALRPDWMGFVFWPKSKRFVSGLPGYMPVHAKRVGVFVDEDVEQVVRTAKDYALDLVQLHGSESPEYVGRLKAATALQLCREVRVIKAFNIATAADFAATIPYEGLADYYLFDTRVTVPAGSPAGSALPGGSGQQFDWSVLASYAGKPPFILSGGIGPDDAARLRSLFRAGSATVAEKCIGIDLNSRFEKAPGLKDVDQLKVFMQSL